MNVLVIGGSGLFGRKTVVHLLEDPEVGKVVSMDLAPPTDWFMKSIEKHKARFAYFRGNVSEFEDCLNAMKLHAIDRVVNWAFIMVGGNVQVDPRLITKVNVMGMCNSFEAAKLMGANRVVYASSQTVYGPQTMYGDREVNEDDQTNPTSSYAVCKKYAEILANDYSHQFGMNFTGIPFSQSWLLGLALATMLGLPVLMLVFFARRGWLMEDRRITSWARLRAWLHRGK